MVNPLAKSLSASPLFLGWRVNTSLWNLRPSFSPMTMASLLLNTPLPWHTIHSYSELPAASWIYSAFVCPHKSAWNPSHQYPGFTDLHWQTPNHLSKLISNAAATVDPHVCKLSTLSQKTCQPTLLWLHSFFTNIYHSSINIYATVYYLST